MQDNYGEENGLEIGFAFYFLLICLGVLSFFQFRIMRAAGLHPTTKSCRMLSNYILNGFRAGMQFHLDIMIWILFLLRAFYICIPYNISLLSFIY